MPITGHPADNTLKWEATTNTHAHPGNSTPTQRTQRYSHRRPHSCRVSPSLRTPQTHLPIINTASSMHTYVHRTQQRPACSLPTAISFQSIHACNPAAPLHPVSAPLDWLLGSWTTRSVPDLSTYRPLTEVPWMFPPTPPGDVPLPPHSALPEGPLLCRTAACLQRPRWAELAPPPMVPQPGRLAGELPAPAVPPLPPVPVAASGEPPVAAAPDDDCSVPWCGLSPPRGSRQCWRQLP